MPLMALKKIDLGQLFQTRVQYHFMRNPAGVEKLLLKLRSSAHNGGVAKVHGVARTRSTVDVKLIKRLKPSETTGMWFIH